MRHVRFDLRERLDLNYLVLSVEIDGSIGDRGVLPKGVISKGGS